MYKNGPIVQRIGHTPSKGTMLVRFQLGLPGNGFFSLREEYLTLNGLMLKKKLRVCCDFFFYNANPRLVLPGVLVSASASPASWVDASNLGREGS